MVRAFARRPSRPAYSPGESSFHNRHPVELERQPHSGYIRRKSMEPGNHRESTTPKESLIGT